MAARIAGAAQKRLSSVLGHARDGMGARQGAAHEQGAAGGCGKPDGHGRCGDCGWRGSRPYAAPESARSAAGGRGGLGEPGNYTGRGDRMERARQPRAALLAARSAAGGSGGLGGRTGRGWRFRAALLAALWALSAMLPLPALAAQGGEAAAHTLSPEDFESAESPYYIYVEKGSHSLTVFIKDGQGRYTLPLKTFPTGTGRTSRMTPAGVFRKGRTEQWHSWGTSYSPFASQYYPGLYVHGPLYAQKNFATLYRNMAVEIGTSTTSGCLRTVAEAAYFVAELCPEGTVIHIVEGSPIGYYADPPNIAEQAANPSGKTLDELFPNLAALSQQALDAASGASGSGGADGPVPHTLEEKLEFAPYERIRLNHAKLVLRMQAGQAEQAGQPESSGANGGSGGGIGAEGAAGANAGATTGGGSGNNTGANANSGSDGATGAHGEAGGGAAPAPAQAAPGPVAEKAKLAARVSPAGAEDSAVLWMSSDSRVATVSQTGTVEARSPGSAQIFAISADGLAAAACDVSVILDAGGQEAGLDLAALAAGAAGTVGNVAAQAQGAAANGTAAAGAAGRAGAQAKPGRLFEDVGRLHWAAGPIEALVRAGAIDGAGAAFYPERDITNAEFVKMLVAALRWRHRPEAGDQAWHEQYARAAMRNGVFGDTAEIKILRAPANGADGDENAAPTGSAGGDDEEAAPAADTGTGDDENAAPAGDASGDEAVMAGAGATGSGAGGDENAALAGRSGGDEPAMADSGGDGDAGDSDVFEFAPDAWLTRGELCEWLDNLIGAGALASSPSNAGAQGAGRPTLSFADAKTIKNADAAARVAASGLLNGFSDGSFRSGAYVSRAMAAAIINNIRKGVVTP
ncbi:MAG: Ig-like domain-containing protein [Clostridiales bacterium]|nr:Ig-like domain-containing protein [Clostridiales bacterium]